MSSVEGIKAVLKPTVFTFTAPERPCTYWSSKFHVIVHGVCRCGLNVRIVELLP